MFPRPLPEPNQHEKEYLIKARQKDYKHSTEIFIPKVPYRKDYEISEKLKRARLPGSRYKKTDPEELKLRASRRAFIRIKDIVLSNDFDLFATFTFKSDRYDPDICKTKLNGWLKRLRIIDKDFQYVVVPEFHKDGIALHFHALIKNYSGPLIRAMSSRTGRPLVKKGRKVYDFPNYSYGNSEVYIIGDTMQDKVKSGFYLLKYIRKDMPVFKGKKKYWASRGLNKSVITENPDTWYLYVEPDSYFENGYGQFYYFNKKKIDIYLSGYPEHLR